MMKFSFLAPLAIAMGLMMSPESLATLGNAVGRAGLPFFGSILLAGAFFIMTAVIYSNIFSLFPGPAADAVAIRNAFGRIPATVFPLSARVTFTLSASTAMLVTAGFVFNEVFLYWFPNFTFAYLLLGFLLGMNLLGQSFAEKLQVFSVIIVLIGLFALSLVGLSTAKMVPAGGPESSTFSLFPTGMYAMLLFIGFDLAFFAKNQPS
jgi:amino acid transporter